ncbi:MAG: CPBP family glutamic-type intramembrane protease [Spirochaetes bacterium]|nr:CPBP family glutamic-type intramembrane protease [Spirochaetota bacterium]
MKRIASTLALFAFLSAAATGAQPVAAGLQPLASGDGGGGLSEIEVLVPPAISAGAVAALFLGSFFEFGSETWFTLGTCAVGQVPLFFVDPLEGLLVAGASGGFYAASNSLQDTPEGEAFAPFAYTGIMQMTMYSTYAAYRDLRVRAERGIFDDGWRKGTPGRVAMAGFAEMVQQPDRLDGSWKPYSFAELFFSPLDGDNWTDPLFWEIAVVGTVRPLVTNSWDSSVFTTGRAYVGGWEVHPLLAIPVMAAVFYLESSLVGVAEESHFRGFLYEEAGRNYGGWYAKLFDCLYFPAVHVPQEIGMEYDTGTIALDFIQRSASTFILDLVYDAGGLKHSVAAHTLIDFTLLFSTWLMRAGEPQTSIEDFLTLVPPLSVGYVYAY